MSNLRLFGIDESGVFRRIHHRIAYDLSNTEPVSASDMAAIRSGLGVAGGTVSGAAAGPHPTQVNVKDFGAVGNGITDDTNAIQLAMEAAWPLGGVAVVFPPGVYRVTSQLKFRNGHTLRSETSAFQAGLGQNVIIRYDAGSGTLLGSNDPASRTENVRIIGLEFDGGTGADVVIDFTRVGYSVLSECNVHGSKADAVGLVIDDAGTSTAYNNVVQFTRFSMGGGGNSANISLRGNATSGANVNYFSHLFIGYANRGIEVNQFSSVALLDHIVFQGIAGVQTALYVAGTAVARSCFFEDAEVAIEVTTTGALARFGNDYGGNLTTKLIDNSLNPIGLDRVLDSDTEPATLRNLLSCGRFSVESPVQFTTASTVEINNQPIAGNGSAILRFFRNTNTTGAKAIQICPGDGSDTVAISFSPVTGDIGVSGKLLSVSSNAALRFPAGNILEFTKGSGSVEAFILGTTGAAAAAQIQNSSGVVSVLRGDGSAFCEVKTKNISIPFATQITFGAGNTGLNFANTEVQFLTLAGNLTLSTANLADGRRVTVYITADGSVRNLTFPAGWIWVGTMPATLAAGTTARLTLFSKGTTDATVYAEWKV